MRVDAERRADLVVERHQREAEAEHADRHDGETARQPAVLAFRAHVSSQYLAMIPRKKASAIEARIKAVLVFGSRHLRTGCVSNVWYGGGVGRCVHSSESAPSQGRCGAGSPLRIVFTTM